MSSTEPSVESLTEENKSLVKDLQICEKLLENYRNCLLVFNNHCICAQNQEIRDKLQKLENYFQSIHQRFAIKYTFITTNESIGGDPQHGDHYQQMLDTSDSYNDNQDFQRTGSFGATATPNIPYEEFSFNNKSTKSVAKSEPKNTSNNSNDSYDMLEPIVIVSEESSDSFDGKPTPRKKIIKSNALKRQRVGNKSVVKELKTGKRVKTIKKPKQELFSESDTNDEIISGPKDETMDAIVCPEIGCEGKTFKSLRNLEKHKRTVHMNERPFTCRWPACKAAFKTNEALTNHNAVHLNVRHHICPVEGCQKSFKLKQTLTQHMRIHEDKSAPDARPPRFVCTWPACGMVCLSGQQLTDHMNRHQRYKPFKCEQTGCGKQFYTAFDLRNHCGKYHNTSDNPELFECDFKECDKKFMTKRDLTLHRRRHGDLSSFACGWPECGARFSCQANLMAHQNIHMNIKAFKCDFVGCDRSYFHKKHLSRHIKKFHNIMPTLQKHFI